MKREKKIILTAFLVIIGLMISSTTGSVEQTSQNVYNFEIDNDEKVVSVLVFLNDQVNLDALTDQLDEQHATLQERHETTVVRLKETAFESQPQLIEYLNELKELEYVEDFKPFWISNVIRVDAYQSVVDQINKHEDVLIVYPNYGIEMIAPVTENPDDGSGSRTPETGVTAVRAPEVWDIGITGEGTLVATLDTGVDGNHPALAVRWAGVADPNYEGHPEWAWFDPYLGQNDFPYDNHGHGTHTMGTVCGGAPGDQIGVAPGALWISAAPIDRGGGIPGTVADAIESFEWLIDPDGDPSTNWDVPDSCSNSWRLVTSHGYPPCDDLFWSYLDACEAAGTVIIFSAGNEGYGGVGRPPDRATDDYRCFAVAAVDANNPSWPIAGFSSRGPTYCTPDGSEAIKPDIAGPGVSVRSSVPGGGYGYMSGTSMASPHINGVVALMRQACPDISVEEIKQIIFDTAYDLGDPGEDNSYGWGMIDAYEAVCAAGMEAPEEPPYEPSNPTPIDGATNVDVDVDLSWIGGDPDEGDIVYYDVYLEANNPKPTILISDDQTETTCDPGILQYGTTYYWKIHAKDNHNFVTRGPVWHFTTEQLQNQPPNTPTIEGPTLGKPGVIYTFEITADDPEGNDVCYFIRWEEGSVTDWTPLQAGGPPGYLENHKWSTNGTFTIEAKARDKWGAESDWGTLEVTMPRGKQMLFNTFFLRLFERFPNMFPMIRQLLSL